jgi:Holliday junction resolvasome RuvABC endonuclease subunit
MNILSLDLGTTTGFAILNKGDITHGFISFKPQRFEGGGMRYLRFSKWLNEISTLIGKIDAVYFEEVRRHLGVDAAHAYGGFLANLTAFCEEKNIPYSGVPVGTIKKHITGKGSAKKTEMIEAVNKLGFPIKDDNEADAVALLLFVTKEEKAKVIELSENSFRY